MKAADIRSPWERLAFLLLAAMWSLGGWLIVLDGGFTRTVKHTTIATRVEGPASLAMAYIFFLLCAIALSVLLSSLAVRRLTIVAAAVVILAAPALYLYVR